MAESKPKDDAEILVMDQYELLVVGVGLAHLVMGMLSVLLSWVSGPEDWYAIAPLNASSLLLCLYYVVYVVRKTPSGLLTDPSVFLVLAFAAYFSFGPLIYVFAPVAASEYSHAYYPASADQVLLLSGLNFIGLGVTLISYACVSSPFMSKTAQVASLYWKRVSPLAAFILFSLAGVTAKYAFVIPYEFGLTDSLPTALSRKGAQLLTVALIVGFSFSRALPKWATRATWIVFIAEIATGLLTLYKGAVLITILAAGVGRFICSGRIRVGFQFAIFAVLFYVLVGPLLQFSRDQIGMRVGDVEVAQATLLERAAVVGLYFVSLESSSQSDSSGRRWWARLNYIPGQVAVLDEVADGRRSDSLSKAKWVVVPRAFYSQKPIMTSAGVDLQERITGFRNSSTGIGIYVDGYWNLGVFGLLLFALSYGAALKILALISRQAVAEQAVVLYPIVFIAVFAALKVDGWWITDVVAPLIIGMLLLGLLFGCTFNLARTNA